VNQNLHKFHGVRNGIDPDIWDPETDEFLPVHYNADNHVAGKAAARRAIRERLGMTGDGDKPMVAVVSR
jgi:starch synthase